MILMANEFENATEDYSLMSRASNRQSIGMCAHHCATFRVFSGSNTTMRELTWVKDHPQLENLHSYGLSKV